ncbi:hypothetical protein N566_13940 [Streptomycetaceae bacterium MP113-05]|nr:hypothetical protein N566_13940 [Streptomycetaceae bacterium MP113-05]
MYTHGHHDSVLRSHRWRTARNSAAYLLPELHAGQRVLDVGCGPGTITADLAAAVGPQGRVTGIDPSADVLAQARTTAAERELQNVEFAVGDVFALECPDDSFDVVHAHQVLQHVGDPVGALRAMRRVCRPGGVVAARDSDYSAMTWYPQVPWLKEWLELYRRVARANGGEPDAGRRLHSWAREAGFEEMTVTASAWCFSGADERTWWSEMWSERTVSSGYARRAVAGGHASEEDLRRIADAWRTWGGHDDGWFAVLHGEVLCRAPSA